MGINYGNYICCTSRSVKIWSKHNDYHFYFNDMEVRKFSTSTFLSELPPWQHIWADVQPASFVHLWHSSWGRHRALNNDMTKRQTSVMARHLLFSFTHAILAFLSLSLCIYLSYPFNEREQEAGQDSWRASMCLPPSECVPWWELCLPSEYSVISIIDALEE